MKSKPVFGLIAPHAPTMLEDELDGISSPIIESLTILGEKYSKADVKLVIAATTHWQTDEFMIDDSADHKTVYDYRGFRRTIEYNVKGDPGVCELLKKAGDDAGIRPVFGKHGTDHAITVPLHFLFPEKDVRVIPISVASSADQSLRWGEVIGNVIRGTGEPVLFMASGSLSHDLSSWIDDYPDPRFAEFDKKVLSLIEEGRGLEVMNISNDEINFSKPEGYFRDLMMLLGVVGTHCKGKVLGYESMPGVGLGVVEFE